jgi:hypothetical protein
MVWPLLMTSLAAHSFQPELLAAHRDVTGQVLLHLAASFSRVWVVALKAIA